MALKGTVALITGGARGIGASAVRLFRQAGARVAFNYRTAKDRAESLATECGGESVCRAFAKDLDSAEAGRALVQDTVAAFGRIDCLVVNHGIWPPDDTPIATMDERQWRRTMDVNLDSVFGLVAAPEPMPTACPQALLERSMSFFMMTISARHNWNASATV